MSPTDELAIDADRAVDRLMRLLAVQGVTGQEADVAKEVTRMLREAGVPEKNIRLDDADTRIPLPTQTGNLIATLPGTRPGPRLLFSTHLDTVPLCAGAAPVKKKDRVEPQGATALGGDNRTGCAVLVTLAATLLARRPAYPPLTLLFTVREESGLWGARHVDPAALGGPAMGFNVDGRLASEITVGAVGAERWEAEITGRASHAGVHPERGISATLVGALALAQVKAAGYFGKIVKEGRTGTSNVGSFGGRDGRAAGEATNVVTDYAHVRGEARSHDTKFVKEIVKVYREAFARAAAEVTDDKGKPAKVKFSSRLDYYPFRLKDDAPVVKRALAAAVRAGLAPGLRVGNGGLDANWLVRHKVPTITFGAGQNEIHTTGEWVDLPEFLRGCRMAVALATQG
jgi:tripeptide aminopeptidase